MHKHLRMHFPLQCSTVMLLRAPAVLYSALCVYLALLADAYTMNRWLARAATLLWRQDVDLQIESICVALTP
jgi:hypothetical protein